MTTAQIVFAASVLAVTALMVWAIRVAQVRESLPAMTATEDGGTTSITSPSCEAMVAGGGTTVTVDRQDLRRLLNDAEHDHAAVWPGPDPGFEKLTGRLRAAVDGPELAPTHVVLWSCGHRETQRCDPGCQHSDEPWQSMLRCGDCIWKETDR